MRQVISSISQHPILRKAWFWILLYGILHCFNITNPPLDALHSWRQSTVLMVARNFLEIDANIFYPRLDFAGEKTGISGMEFPLLNYCIYLVSSVFGYEHWYGRIIVLVSSSLGAYAFSRLALFFSQSRKIALYATIILLSSLWFTYSRKTMPDVFAASLMLLAIDQFRMWLTSVNRKALHLILFFVFTVLGGLSKLPVFVMLGILPSILYLSGASKRQWIMASIVIISTGIPSIYWYFFWVPYLVQEFGFWHFFMGIPFSEGVKQVIQLWPNIIDNFYDSALKFVGFGMLVFGLIGKKNRHHKMAILALGLVVFMFSFIILKSGRTFAFHDYYMIPVVPFMALISAFGISKIKHHRFHLILVAVIALEGILNQWHDVYIRNHDAHLATIEAELDQFIPKDDLIFINSEYNPTAMYSAHRKGWIGHNEDLTEEKVDSLNQLGLKHILILRNNADGDTTLPYHMTAENLDWRLFTIRP